MFDLLGTAGSVQTTLSSPIAIAIVACEIGFWVVLGAGLAVRYLLRRPRLGGWILVGVPVVDLALLVFTALDLRNGAPASWLHGMAALYLGFSVAFGHRMIRWADAHVAHRFAGGPRPSTPPRTGPARVAKEWKDFGLAVLAAVITVAAVLLLRLFAQSADQTAALMSRIPTVGMALLIWLAVGPIWATLTTGRSAGAGAAAGQTGNLDRTGRGEHEHPDLALADQSGVDHRGDRADRTDRLRPLAGPQVVDGPRMPDPPAR